MINAEYINKVEDIYTDNGSSTMTIESMDYFDGEQYDIYDQKDYARFIKDAETACRNSFEYRQLIYYLKNSEGMNVCSFLGNVTNIDSNKVKIEIHHSPCTLFDIVSAVIKRRLHDKESIDIFDITKEVVLLHYLGYVGLIPVSESIHQLIHNQYIFVPTSIVRGNWRKFIELYYDYISPEVLDAVDAAEEMTKEWQEDMTNMNNLVNQQMQILNLHTTYINYKNIDRVSKIETSRDEIKDKISEIKSTKKLLYKLVNKTGETSK